MVVVAYHIFLHYFEFRYCKWETQIYLGHFVAYYLAF